MIVVVVSQRYKMQEQKSVIMTGVDKLVDLVKNKKRISFSDAAKELGVSKIVIEEWTNFLEEEGLISIEYVFTIPYIVVRKLTKKEGEQIAREFKSSKEVFVRKAESVMQSLDSEVEKIQGLKDEFNHMKGELSEELSSVRKEFEELQTFEDLKSNIDAKMINQKNELMNNIHEMDDQIKSEQRKYEVIIDEISAEESRLDKEQLVAHNLEAQEEKLKQNIHDFNDMLNAIREKVKLEQNFTYLSEKHIENSRKLTEKLKGEMKLKKEHLDKIIKESHEKSDRILQMQDSIMHKLMEKKKTIDTDVRKSKRAFEGFQDFFQKKRDIEIILDKINRDGAELRQELDNLIKKAIVASIIRKDDSVEKHVNSLNQHLMKILKKKQLFEDEIKKLKHVLTQKLGNNTTPLHNYIKTALEKDVDKETIKNTLVKHGWKDKEVEKALEYH